MILAEGEKGARSVAEVNRAAGQLYAAVATWIGGYLRNKGFSLSDDDRQDILQHLLLRASTGTARFRGATEGEAHAWCRRVIYNKAVDLVTITNREEHVEAVKSSAVPVAAAPVASDGEVSAASKRIQAMIGRVEETIVRTSRANDAPGLLTSFRCHVDARLGASIEAQIEKYAWTGEHANAVRSEDELVRARNRVYQWRKRGREAGCRALRSLRAAGTDDEEAVSLMARFLGCKEGECGPRVRKESLS